MRDPIFKIYCLHKSLLCTETFYQVRIDAYKYTTQIRRPKAQQVENIGAWLGILKTITFTAVVLNVNMPKKYFCNNFVLHQATIVALTSEFIQRQYYMFQVNVPNNTLDGYVDFTFTGKLQN